MPSHLWGLPMMVWAIIFVLLAAGIVVAFVVLWMKDSRWERSRRKPQSSRRTSLARNSAISREDLASIEDYVVARSAESIARELAALKHEVLRNVVDGIVRSIEQKIEKLSFLDAQAKEIGEALSVSKALRSEVRHLRDEMIDLEDRVGEIEGRTMRGGPTEQAAEGSAERERPLWLRQLETLGVEERKLKQMSILTQALTVLDRTQDGYATLFADLSVHLGTAFYEVTSDLPRTQVDEVTGKIETWVEQNNFPYMYIIPRMGHGFSSGKHIAADGDGEYANASEMVTGVVCWGIKERSGAARVIRKANVMTTDRRSSRGKRSTL